MADKTSLPQELHTPTNENLDLEIGDHAVSQNIGIGEALHSSKDEISTEKLGDEKDEALSRQETHMMDDDDPFALFPSLSISMSSTNAPYVRRGTITSLGRPLTRAETMETLKSVRSRFTEVRNEFDENVLQSLCIDSSF